MRKLSPEERPIIGQIANEVRSEIEEKISTVKETLKKMKQKKAKLEKEKK